MFLKFVAVVWTFSLIFCPFIEHKVQCVAKKYERGQEKDKETGLKKGEKNK